VANPATQLAIRVPGEDHPFIGRHWVAPASDCKVEISAAATGEVVALVPDPSREDAGRAVAAKAAVPSVIEAGRGGSIVLTSSLLDAKGFANGASYVSAKRGVIGLTWKLGKELGQYRIRVSSLQTTNVDTPTINNPDVYALFRPDIEGEVAKEHFIEAATSQNVIPIPYIEPVDISNAILWVASDEARYVTGVALPTEADAVIKQAAA
jgi:NAD(P)-dependent dehydrogenase (short-subunit alcohol dehydrogenase family)